MNIPIRELHIEEEYWCQERCRTSESFFGNVDKYWVKKTKYSKKLQYFRDGVWKDIPTESQVIKCSDRNPEQERIFKEFAE